VSVTSATGSLPRSVRIEVGVHKGGKRPELRALFGSIMVFADEAEIRLESDLGETQAALVRAAGGSANNVVAGTRVGFRTPLNSLIFNCSNLHRWRLRSR
jgi:hypothetical protein